ncbi:dual specificity protein phosphatase family protein [Nanoarchaeota archaeon]
MSITKWFSDGKNKLNPFQMLKPYSNICIGPNPIGRMSLEFAKSFDIFMSVSSIPYYILEFDKPRKDTLYFWYPLIELGFWGYEPFFWSKQILDRAFEESKSVYLHCDAGVNRSPCIALAWLTSRNHSLDEASYIASGGKPKITESMLGEFNRNLSQGNIPDQLPEFYKNYNPLDSLEGNLLNAGLFKYEHKETKEELSNYNKEKIIF